jgi:thioredoxin reductase
MEEHDVVIIGGGPTGLAAAMRLRDLGIRDVVVLEREHEAGGIPRHCGHAGFGWQSHRRIWTGPRFAEALRRDAEGLDVRSGTTVLSLGAGGQVKVRSAWGMNDLVAKRVLVATGTRETTRAARFVGGSRPQGVMNTGALQQHVYLRGFRPFSRPVIIGTEWVSFSAILTCRHLGIRPVAMIEEKARIDAPRPGDLVARFAYGVPVWTSTKVIAIEGRQHVEGVRIEKDGREETVACDGVIVTGKFRPENALFQEGPFAVHDLAPKVDGDYRTNHPQYFAAGNVLAPLKTSGRCWQQGRAAADALARSLA